MRHYITLLFVLIAGTSFAQVSDSAVIKSIYNKALTDNQGYEWLDDLCKTAPKRLSGSEGMKIAVEYTFQQLQRLNYGTVYKQDVMVPHWVRGDQEFAFIEQGGKKIPLSICALGRSIGTPPQGITGGVIEIKDFDELEKRKDEIKGKIVFYNHPMDPTHYNTFNAYGAAVQYRWAGANRASKYGAIGVIVRSMTLAKDDYPHTGSMAPYDSLPPIPACAVSTVGADKLSAELKKRIVSTLTIKLSCNTLPDAPSYNVIAEIKGSEFPNEIIVVGGHLDAWDKGVGAHDDGAGVTQSMEVIRLFKELNIKPKRTVRCVLFTNEENGGKGGEKYAAESKEKKENNIAAIESDAGGGGPRGFSFKGDEAMAKRIMKHKELLFPYGVYDWKMGWGGADIDHMHDHGTLCIGLMSDSQRYFDYHHADSDTFDKVNKRELELGAAAMASLVYLLSEYGVK